MGRLIEKCRQETLKRRMKIVVWEAWMWIVEERLWAEVVSAWMWIVEERLWAEVVSTWWRVVRELTKLSAMAPFIPRSPVHPATFCASNQNGEKYTLYPGLKNNFKIYSIKHFYIPIHTKIQHYFQKSF